MEDELGYLTPNAASQLQQLTDSEVLRLYRKIAFENPNAHPWDRRIELELMGRFTIALTEFRDASEAASNRLGIATWAITGLTVVVAVFTVALFFRG
jgi:hypothetical protein